MPMGQLVMGWPCDLESEWRLGMTFSISARSRPQCTRIPDCEPEPTHRQRIGVCSFAANSPMHSKRIPTRYLARCRAGALAGAFLTTCLAAQEVYPLPSSAIVGTHPELTAPFLLPARCVQTKLADRNTLEVTQNLPQTFGVWDMLSIGPNSRYLFVPTEVPTKAGVFRFDTITGNVTVLMLGNGVARIADPATWSASNDDFAKLDPTKLTAWGSIITAEEEVGGRLFEVANPYASGGFQIQWHSRIPSVRHEGLGFDAAGALYFVDEDNSGSIYKFVPTTPGDLSVGQSFALSVDAFAANPAARPNEEWFSTQNLPIPRVGAATWAPITDALGNVLTVADPFAYVTVSGGRDAADEVLATPFGRPEDVEIGTLANGRECLYVALTGEHTVLSIELVSSTSAIVRKFVDRTTLELVSGTAIGADFTAPDNLAQDAFGVIYICEDHEPGDIFKAIDADGDGVAEALGRFASLDVAGAEPSGLIFDPNDPYRCYCNVMNPASANDALWSLQTRPYPGDGSPWLLARSSTSLSEPLRHGVAEFVDIAQANDIVTLAVDPRPALHGNPFVIAAEPLITALGAPGFLLPAWINPSASIVLRNGALGSLPSSPPYGGNAVSLPVPFGLAGLSVLVQGVVLEPGFGLIWSDGIELILQ